MVTPTLGAAFTHALEAGRNLGPRGMPVTLERASQVFQDGRVEVLGTRIPVTGSGARGLRAGEMVAVSWQRGQPVVAIRHSARRTGPVSPQPRLGAGIVEELILGPPTAGSSARDYWFRNDTVLERLGINTILGASPTSGPNVWGLSRQHFVARTVTFPALTFVYHVFSLGRDPTTVLTSAPVPTLVGSYTPHTSALVLGTFTTLYSGFTFNPPIVLGTLLTTGYSSGDGGVRYIGNLDDWMVDDRGHLLISVRVIIEYRYTSPLPNWRAAVPYIIDMTDEVVLYAGTDLIGTFGVTAHSPVSIDLDALPLTPGPTPPMNQVIDPFASFMLFFVHAAAGVPTVFACGIYRWAVEAPGGGLNPPLFDVGTKFMILRPALSTLTVQDFAVGTIFDSPSDGIFVVPGLSEEYVVWVPFTHPSNSGGLQKFLPSGSTASLVNMTRFAEPTDTEQVSASLDAFFTPQLVLLDPTALYNSTDANDDTGHYFVEFLEDGDLALDSAAAGFPLKDSRPNEKAGFLLDYPAELAFLQISLADAVEGEDPLEAFLSLKDRTDYQLILDTAVAGELPI